LALLFARTILVRKFAGPVRILLKAFIGLISWKLLMKIGDLVEILPGIPFKIHPHESIGIVVSIEEGFYTKTSDEKKSIPYCDRVEVLWADGARTSEPSVALGIIE